MRRRDFVGLGVAAGLSAVAAPRALAQPRQGRWMVGETPLARIFCESGEEALGRMAGVISRTDRLLRHLTRSTLPEPATKLDVYLVGWTPSLAEAYGRAAGAVAGFYTRSPEHTAIVAYGEDRDNLHISPLEILRHEYSHHFMYYHSPGVYPTWYQEGFAELIGAVREEGDRFLVGRVSRVRASWLIHEDWLPLEDMFTRPIADMEDDDVAMFYAQSWLLTHYVMFDPDRQAAFNRYVLALREGQDAIPAFEAAFGMTINEADIALKQYRREPLEAFYYTLPDSPAAISAIEATPLSAAANALLMTGVRMRSSDTLQEAQETAQRVRERAADFRDDPLVALELARAEAMGGDPAVAQGILADRLAAAPDDAEAHYLMGLSHVRPYLGRQPGAAEAAQRARRSFAAANEARPDHYPTLYRYAQCEVLNRGSLSPAALDVAVRAHDLAPQVNEIAVFAAFGLLQAGRAEEAADAARLVAYSPHVSGEVEIAREILRRARAASGQAAP